MAKFKLQGATGKWSKRGRKCFYMDAFFKVQVMGTPVDVKSTFVFSKKGDKPKYVGSRINIAKAPAELRNSIAEEAMGILRNQKENA